MPCSSTPAERSHQARCGVTPVVFRSNNDIDSAIICFRGSITWPADPLCTLRRRDRSHSTQHSVPADGQSLPVRDLHPTGRNKRFPIAYSMLAFFLLFQALPGAISVHTPQALGGFGGASRRFSCAPFLLAEGGLVRGGLNGNGPIKPRNGGLRTPGRDVRACIRLARLGGASITRLDQTCRPPAPRVH